MRLRSTISGAETLPEMHTSTPQPECMRIPKASFFILKEDALQNAFKRQAYSREKVGRDALIGGNGKHLSKECCAAPCLVNPSSQLKQRHRFSLRTPKALPILSLLTNRISLDVVKHARLSGFFKPVSPHQRWHPQPKPGNENCRSRLSLDGRRSPACSACG